MVKLPATPADVLEISSPLRRFRLNLVIKSAEFLGYWSRPYKKAETAAEEMKRMDGYYWVYKSKNPITEAEKGVQKTVGTILELSLPSDFIESVTLTFSAVGDLLWSDNLEYSKGILFDKISDLLFEQNISYANFESPITRQTLIKEKIGDSGPPIECCSAEQFEVLKGHKESIFTVMNIANNHMFDMGTEGINTTLKTFREQGILGIGINIKPEEFGLGKILIKNGVKFGFVSATFGLNGRDKTTKEDHGINVAKILAKSDASGLDFIKAQIADCQRQKCDFIFASLHWGYEFEFFPRKWQMDIAHALVEYGVDAIIGHHPHVVQPVEYYRTQRDPHRVAIIAYSLGSLTWRFTAPHLVLSAVLNLKISKGILDGHPVTYIKQACATPIFRSSVTWAGKLLTRLEKLSDHIAGRSNTHEPEYIRQIQAHSELVLGAQNGMA